MRAYRLILSLLLISSGVISCSEDTENTVGYDLSELQETAPLVVELTPSSQDTYYRAEFSGDVGIKSSLAFGRFGDTEARAFLRFDEPPGDLGTQAIVRERVQWVEATLTLYGYAQSDSVPFTFSVYEVTQPFNPYEFSWENAALDSLWDTPGGTFAEEPIVTQTVTIHPAVAGDSIGIDISSVLEKWYPTFQDTLDRFYALAIVPDENMQSMVHVYAGDVERVDANIPYQASYPKISIRYNYVKTTGEDTIAVDQMRVSTTNIGSSATSYDDGYIVKPITPTGVGQQPFLELNSGQYYRGLMRFDLRDIIPTDATINYAELTLFADSTMSGMYDKTYRDDSLFVSIDYMNVLLLPLEEAWDEDTNTTELDFGISQQVAGLDIEITPGKIDTLRYRITNLVQLWSLQPESNFGFMLRSGWEGANFSVGRIFTREAEPTLQPRLKIHYTVPPRDPWEN
ncbi:MAG: DNRLRE domain-containing protein [Gemmatimonadetes bacterium]|nr:MAG: DNRLRE domain-containing protein [Gemmatimonadota bacterium]